MKTLDERIIEKLKDKNKKLETKIEKIWKFCEEEQIKLSELEKECGNSEYCQGEIIAYRKVQHKINGRCSELSKFVTYDNVY